MKIVAADDERMMLDELVDAIHKENRMRSWILSSSQADCWNLLSIQTAWMQPF